jgi:hypothetical protein
VLLEDISKYAMGRLDGFLFVLKLEPGFYPNISRFKDPEL